ncbi:AraC family transcriptional regulator [Actinoplanes sp. NBRC 101535]|uniref:helix-turn-helix domain-containing protein n=1 Tax=Actinoplanes sp. NBRC 101535 TaxID=3032196 RepID=UPI002553FDAF|nr:AraC family transcriptional regulator [Actinoplanes sp. NBRC 101535]
METPRHDDLGLGTWRRDPGTVVLQGAATPLRDPGSLAIVAESWAHVVPTEWSPHVHLMHELVWVRGGTLTSRIGNRIFTVPPGFGMWMPAGMVHGGRVTYAAEFHDAFFVPERTPVVFDGPTTIIITPLLESLLLRLGRSDLGDDERARTEAVVFDVLEAADRQFALDLPGDRRIDAIAEALLRDPSDDRSLAEWAAHLKVSDRTITRAFREATGLSFAQWRQALRIHEALALLSAGAEVQEVSELLGYSQPSTFIAAFRRVMKVTPGLLTKASLSGIPYQVS